ncbi:hypothetical protein EBZ80_02345 [bacterium]|nr:hypothetical protein [bacterium]
MKFLFLLVSAATMRSHIRSLGINVYNGAILSPSKTTQEHIIPSSYFPDPRMAQDWVNLVSCDAFTNSLRSDLRLGDPRAYEAVFRPLLHRTFAKESVIGHTGIRVVVDSTGRVSGLINRSERLFIPSPNADLGLLSRSIVALLSRYPVLYRSLPYICDTRLLSDYHDATSDLERRRENLLIGRTPSKN